MASNNEKIFVDNDTEESLLLNLSPEEIDKLYNETFHKEEKAEE